MHYTVKDIAKALNTSPLTIRKGLEQGIFPFGCAVECEKRFAYLFFPNKVKEYLGEVEEQKQANTKGSCLI